MTIIAHNKLYKQLLNELDKLELKPENGKEVFQQTLDKYSDKIKQTSDFKFFLLEHEIYHIGKSVSNGFSPMMSGTKRNEEGQEEQVIWPDFNKYDEESFKYYDERFVSSNNPYLKSQYGLMTYIYGNLKNNTQKSLLVETLIKYAYSCYSDKTDTKSYKNEHIFSECIRNAFEIAVKSKFSTQIEEILNFLFDKYKLLTTSDYFYYSIFDLISDLVLTNKKEVGQTIDINVLSQKIYNDFKKSDNSTNLHSSIRSLKKGLGIAVKYNLSNTTQWQKEIGEMLESAADEEINRKNFFGASMYEQAAQFYKDAKEPELVKNVLLKYQASRTLIKLDSFRSELSDEEIDSIEDYIEGMVNKKNPILIILLWTLRPNIRPIANIRFETAPEPKDFLSGIGTETIDKYGNTAERYQTPDQLKEHRFWEQYGMELNFASKLSYKATLKAIKSGVINSNAVIAYLKTTWLNNVVQHYYHGEPHSHYSVPLDLLTPAINNLFESLENFVYEKKNITASDFVLPMDSLVLKIEYILRLMCEKLEIPTVVLKPSNNKFQVPRAKTLTHLFQNLEEENFLNQEDIAILNYLFILPEHLNIRNEIAHGLYIIDEYSPFSALKILGGIICLSRYQFDKL